MGYRAFLALQVVAVRVAEGIYKTKIRPLLEKRCMPCHFPGGKVYTSLPFDRPPVPKRLGERLFTRIKDPQDQTILRRFLAEPPEEEAALKSPNP